MKTINKAIFVIFAVVVLITCCLCGCGQAVSDTTETTILQTEQTTTSGSYPTTENSSKSTLKGEESVENTIQTSSDDVLGAFDSD